MPETQEAPTAETPDTENEAQETQETPETTETPVEQDSFDTIVINEIPFTLRGTKQKKGKVKGKLLCILEPDKAPDGSLDYQALFDKLAQAVGKENWFKTVFAEVVRQSCLDATTQALKASEDGIPHDEDYAQGIIQYYLPSTRRTGEHVKDLRERAMAIYAEAAPMLLRLHTPADSPDYRPLTPEEQNRCVTLMEEFTTINQKLEDKSRTGKGKKKKA